MKAQFCLPGETLVSRKKNPDPDRSQVAAVTRFKLASPTENGKPWLALLKQSNFYSVSTFFNKKNTPAQQRVWPL